MSWLSSQNDQLELDMLTRSQSTQRGWSHPSSPLFLEFFAAFITGGPFPAVLPCYLTPFLPVSSTLLRGAGRLWERLWELYLLEKAELNSIESIWGTSTYHLDLNKMSPLFLFSFFSLLLSFPPAFPLYLLFTTLAPTPTPIALCLMLSSSVPSFYK